MYLNSMLVYVWLIWRQCVYVFTCSALSHCSGSPRQGVGRVDRRQWNENPNTWYTCLTKSKHATISSSSWKENEEKSTITTEGKHHVNKDNKKREFKFQAGWKKKEKISAYLMQGLETSTDWVSMSDWWSSCEKDFWSNRKPDRGLEEHSQYYGNIPGHFAGDQDNRDVQMSCNVWTGQRLSFIQPEASWNVSQAFCTAHPITVIRIHMCSIHIL